MEIPFHIALAFLYSLSVINALILLKVFAQRFMHGYKEKQSKQVYHFLTTRLSHEVLEKKSIEKINIFRKGKLLDQEYYNLCQNHYCSNISKNFATYYRELGRFEKIGKRLKSKISQKRIDAVSLLGHIKDNKSVDLLETAFMVEQNNFIKLLIINALVDLSSEKSIPVILSRYPSMTPVYREKARTLICSFGEMLYRHIISIIGIKDQEIIKLIIYFSRGYSSNKLKSFLISHSKSNDLSIVRLAVKALSRNYHYTLDDDYFISHTDAEVRKEAIISLSKLHTKQNIDRLLNLLIRKEDKDYLIYSISTILRQAPEHLSFVSQRFLTEEDQLIKQNMVDILSNRIEYYLLQINSREKKYIKLILVELIKAGRVSQIIGFLNKNKDEAIEKEMIKVVNKSIFSNRPILNIDRKLIMKYLVHAPNDMLDEMRERANDLKTFRSSFINTDSTHEYVESLKKIIFKGKHTEDDLIQLSIAQKVYIKSQFRTYLNDKVLQSTGLNRYKIIKKRKKENTEKEKILYLKIILIVVLSLFPLFFLFYRTDFISSNNIISIIRLFVVDFNYYLVFYSLSVNFIAIFLLILSFLGANKQYKTAKFKPHSFIFKQNILPSISIIAPAYNEQETIIESVNSLLNLKYPNYELIVVNDGSPDETLNVLIKYFDLEKVDLVLKERLGSQPIMGLYTNPSIPNLIIVDKANGGKADALNVGINVSQNEYICSIDSDSLLEPEALLKLAQLALQDEKECIALGGNIFPVNSCTVNKGHILKKKMPTNSLARFQTIEYIRAFMSGRIGWAYLNSLLIISGAFGLFKKEKIIQIGGYLTSTGKYRKDTVGEDMELVVRVSRYMQEHNLPYSVKYAYNANCWTEVPESMTIFRNQRDRWHRGLIDILHFHRKIIFNYKYRNLGLVGMPYFFIFEMIGPIIEFQGYVMVYLAFILGLINKSLALILFISSIALGLTVSIASILLVEKEKKILTTKDIWILILYAFIENIGFRQIVSFFRVKGFFSTMKKSKGWGTMVRKKKNNIICCIKDQEEYRKLSNELEKLDCKSTQVLDSRTALQVMEKESPRLFIYQEEDGQSIKYVIKQFEALYLQETDIIVIANSNAKLEQGKDILRIENSRLPLEDITKKVKEFLEKEKAVSDKNGNKRLRQTLKWSKNAAIVSLLIALPFFTGFLSDKEETEPFLPIEEEKRDSSFERKEERVINAPINYSYYIIAGCFKHKENANKLLNTLKNGGFENAEEIELENKMFAVSYKKFCDTSHANIFLKEIKKIRKDAWIHIKEGS